MGIDETRLSELVNLKLSTWYMGGVSLYYSILYMFEVFDKKGF